ncbi:MAG TPA: hypothetical protein DC054_24930 [Blastocatellia bacterium]|nr:hypothetical protein [Blastocatellia bacterium]
MIVGAEPDEICAGRAHPRFGIDTWKASNSRTRSLLKIGLESGHLKARRRSSAVKTHKFLSEFTQIIGDSTEHSRWLLAHSHGISIAHYGLKPRMMVLRRPHFFQQ